MTSLVKVILTESEKGALTEATIPVELRNEDGTLRTVQIEVAPMIDFIFSHITD